MADQALPVILAPDLTIDALMENLLLLSNNFYEPTTNAFAVPAVGADVTIPVVDSARYAAGVYLYISGIGVFMVASIPSETTIGIRNVSAVPATVVPTGTPMATCAPPFDASTLVGSSFVYDVLAATFVAPAAGATADLRVATGGWFVVDLPVFIPGLGVYIVQALDGADDTHCTVRYDNTTVSLGVINRAAHSVAAGTPVFPCSRPMFIPDEVSLVATNASNRPGRAQVAIEPVFYDQAVRHSGRSVPLILDGEEKLTTAGAVADSNNTSVAFSTAFNAIPNVLLSLKSEANEGVGLYDLTVYARNVTVNGFDIYLTKSATALTDNKITVAWLAIGV